MKYLLLALLLVIGGCKAKKTGVQTSSSAPVVRDQYTTGFLPRTAGNSPFPQSQYEADLSEVLDFPDNKPPHKQPRTRIVEPGKFQSWQEVGLNDANFDVFLITPGDYTSLGRLDITLSGTASKRRVVRYYNPKAADPYNPPHPVRMAGKPDQEVVLEAIRLESASYWVFHGLTFRGKGVDKKGFVGGMITQIAHGADHNVINYCLFEKFLAIAAIRIYNASYNTIQNSVVRDKGGVVGVDMGGIGISATEGKESRGNRIVNNEIYNVTDAVGLIYNVARDGDEERSQTGSVPATILENNDFYITEDLYRQKGNEEWACAENAIDLKSGTKSTLPADRIRIVNNRMWGFRPTDQSCGGSGSPGTGIVFHRNASNILIQDNIFLNMAQGISVFGVNPKYPEEKVENVAIINNLFYDIKQTTEIDVTGDVFRFSTGVDAYYNTICRAPRLMFVKEKTTTNRFQCNTIIDVKEATPWKKNRQSYANLNAWYGYPDRDSIYSFQGRQNTFGASAAEAGLEDYSFYVRRWTGPERVTLKGVVPGKSGKRPQIKPEDGCHCGPGGEGGRWWVE